MIVYHNFNNAIEIVSNRLKTLQCHVILLKFNKSISLHFASKISRIFGFIIHKTSYNNCFFCLSDADMFPISKSYFNDFAYHKLILKSFDKKGYGYGNDKGKWAMCYMIADKFTWYEILADNITDNNLLHTISSVIHHELKKGIKHYESFAYLDEVYLRDKIKEWKHYNRRVLFHVRNYKGTRIDRNNLNKTSLANLTNIIDIHLPELNNNIKSIWSSKIILLEKIVFNYIPYDMDYIKSLYLLK